MLLVDGTANWARLYFHGCLSTCLTGRNSHCHMYVGCGRVCVTYYSMMALERFKDTPQQNIQNRLVLYRAGVHDMIKRVNFLEPPKVLTHVHKMLHGERESLCKPKRGEKFFRTKVIQWRWRGLLTWVPFMCSCSGLHNWMNQDRKRVVMPYKVRGCPGT